MTRVRLPEYNNFRTSYRLTAEEIREFADILAETHMVAETRRSTFLQSIGLNSTHYAFNYKSEKDFALDLIDELVRLGNYYPILLAGKDLLERGVQGEKQDKVIALISLIAPDSVIREDGPRYAEQKLPVQDTIVLCCHTMDQDWVQQEIVTWWKGREISIVLGDQQSEDVLVDALMDSLCTVFPISEEWYKDVFRRIEQPLQTADFLVQRRKNFFLLARNWNPPEILGDFLRGYYYVDTPNPSSFEAIIGQIEARVITVFTHFEKVQRFALAIEEEIKMGRMEYFTDQNRPTEWNNPWAVLYFNSLSEVFRRSADRIETLSYQMNPEGIADGDIVHEALALLDEVSTGLSQALTLIEIGIKADPDFNHNKIVNKEPLTLIQNQVDQATELLVEVSGQMEGDWSTHVPQLAQLVSIFLTLPAALNEVSREALAIFS